MDDLYGLLRIAIAQQPVAHSLINVRSATGPPHSARWLGHPSREGFLKWASLRLLLASKGVTAVTRVTCLRNWNQQQLLDSMRGVIKSVWPGWEHGC